MNMNCKRLLLLSSLLVMMAVVLARTVTAATFSAAPTTGSYTVGQSVPVTVRLNSSGAAINAGEATVTWTPTTLQFVSVSSTGSIFKYWPIDPSARGTSSVVFSGGLPSPGFTGSAGTVLRISFLAKAAGTATVSFTGGKILANDGLGTDLYTGQGSATYTIAVASKPTTPPPAPEVPNRPTPAVSSSSHSDQSSWYREPEVKLAWTKPNGLRGVSYSVTQDPTTTPDDQVDSTGATTTITLPSDGIWYFHLHGKYDSGWSATSHFALRLDRTPPETFTPVVVQDRGLSDPTPSLTFATTDTPSGIAKYTYAVDGGAAVPATSPTDLSGLSAGKHTVVVTAYDQAGNIREGQASLSIEGYTAPTITFVSTPLLLFEPLVVRGTANIGDTITVYVNNQAVGQVVAGPSDAVAAPGVTLRVPWSFTTDKLFRPGTFAVTATATSKDGQVSAATDPRQVRVNGQALTLNGRPIATFSIITPIVVLFISLLLTIAAIMARLGLAVWMMHRHEDTAEEELETLREVNKRQSISRQQLDSALIQIEQDLDGGRPARRSSARRRPKKRSR